MERETPAVGSQCAMARDESESAAATSGPVTGIEDAYRAFRSGLLGFLRANVHDRSLAEDLLHEVFIKASRALDQGEQPDTLSAWPGGPP